MIGIGSQDIITLIIYSAMGLGLGLGVNKLNKVLDEKVPSVYEKMWASIPLKLLLVAIVLVAVQFGSESFARNWQSTTPGIFFVTLFFGMQTSLMEDALSLTML